MSYPLGWLLSKLEKLEKMLVRIWRDWNPYTLLIGLQNSAASMKKLIEALKKKNHRTTIHSSNLTSLYISKRKENRLLKRYSHTHVHGSTIYSSQEVKALRYPSTNE